MPSIAVTIDKLEVSPLNVRRDARDIEATEAMEASLLAKGQLMPLVVHPMKGSKDRLGVVAGGRRYRAFKKLIARAALPADHPIDVVVRAADPAELVELSTTENLIRRDLRSYEVAAAVRSAHQKGRSVAELAVSLGQESIWVKQQLRLGGLHPEVFAAFAGDAIGYDQAAAYAATEDQDLQIVVFRELQAQPFDSHRDARSIRNRLKVDDRELAQLLRLVGDDAYRAAGGGFELDLFAAEAQTRGRVADEALLRRLASDAMEVTREELRRRTGRETLRFVTEPPRSEYGTDYSLQVHLDLRQLDVDLPVGDIVCWLKSTDQGPPEPSFWWASRKAKHGAGGKGGGLFERMSAIARSNASPAYAAIGMEIAARDHDAVRAVNASIKDDDGVTANGVEIFRSLRRGLLRAVLIWNARERGDVGVDLLVWSQLRMIGGEPPRSTHAGVGRIAVLSDPEIARPHLDATTAQKTWEDARREVFAAPAFQQSDSAESFSRWRAEAPELKRLGAAVVAGMALERSLNAHGYLSPVHDAVAAECHVTGADEQRLRDLVSPTPELLALLPRVRLLDIASQFVDRSSIERWRKGKASALPSLVAKVLRGESGASGATDTTGKKVAARQWVHDLLRFPAKGQTLAEVDAAEQMADGDELLERAAS